MLPVKDGRLKTLNKDKSLQLCPCTAQEQWPGHAEAALRALHSMTKALLAQAHSKRVLEGMQLSEMQIHRCPPWLRTAERAWLLSPANSQDGSVPSLSQQRMPHTNATGVPILAILHRLLSLIQDVCLALRAALEAASILLQSRGPHRVP